MREIPTLPDHSYRAGFGIWCSECSEVSAVTRSESRAGDDRLAPGSIHIRSVLGANLSTDGPMRRDTPEHGVPDE